MRSARLTALATTSTSTSPGPATGSGISVHSRTSGPPGSRTVIAYMDRTLFGRPPGRRAARSSGMDPPDPWPLRHLVLRTPRLELRPDDDAGLFELAEEARLGVHRPEHMPFLVPWTDVDPDERARATVRWHWET